MQIASKSDKHFQKLWGVKKILHVANTKYVPFYTF